MYNVIKLPSPFERLKSYNSSPEVSLFKAVIVQAIIDCTNTSNSNESRCFEIAAKTWLFGQSRDFLDICDFAEMTAWEVQKRAKEAIKLHHKACSSEKSSMRREMRDGGVEEIDEKTRQMPSRNL